MALHPLARIDERFDVLACPRCRSALTVGALHLFPDPALAIREIGRCLAPGGSFTCLTAGRAEGGLWARRQWLFTRLTGFRFFAEDELKGELARAGLEPVRFERWQQVLLFAARKPG